MMTGTLAPLMWLMMGLMLFGLAADGITWARRRGRGDGPAASPAGDQAADDKPHRSLDHAGPENPADES
jgi:hypothetical protein